MYENEITKFQLGKIQEMYKNIQIINPVKGNFASGGYGIGALQGVKETANFIHKLFYKK